GGCVGGVGWCGRGGERGGAWWHRRERRYATPALASRTALRGGAGATPENREHLVRLDARGAAAVRDSTRALGVLAGPSRVRDPRHARAEGRALPHLAGSRGAVAR